MKLAKTKEKQGAEPQKKLEIVYGELLFHNHFYGYYNLTDPSQAIPQLVARFCRATSIASINTATV